MKSGVAAPVTVVLVVLDLTEVVGCVVAVLSVTAVCSVDVTVAAVGLFVEVPVAFFCDVDNIVEPVSGIVDVDFGVTLVIAVGVAVDIVYSGLSVELMVVCSVSFCCVSVIALVV